MGIVLLGVRFWSVRCAMHFSLVFAAVLVSVVVGYGGKKPRDQPKDCLLRWSNWYECSKTCGGGKQSRVARIIQSPVNGGKPCGPLTESRSCNDKPCVPADVPVYTTKKYDDYTTKKSDDYTTKKADDYTTKKYDDYTTKKADDYTTKKYYDYTTKKADDYTTRKYYDYTTKRTPPTRPSDVPGPIMCSMLPDGNYPSGKCERVYFTCASQKLTTLNCPAGQIYDPANDWCDVPSNTETCTGTPPTPVPTEPVVTRGRPVPDAHFNCVEKSNGDFADPELPCSKIYYTCSNGITSRRSCPLNLWFDPELLICDSYQRVPICAGHPRTTETTPVTEPTHETTLAPFDCIGKRGNHADPTHSCSHVYYACHAGITDTFLCPEDLFYDASRDLCDLKDFIVACGGAPAVEHTTQQSETLPPVDFDCNGKSDAFYSDPKSQCSGKYYACIGELAREFECQSGLIYSASLGACAHAEDTWECTGSSPTPSTTVEFIPSTTEVVPFDCSAVGNGFFVDPLKKCSDIYYSCSGGIAHLLKCPSGTFYDPDQHWCDFYDHVYDCSGHRVSTVVTDPTIEILTTPPEYDCSKLSDGLYPIPGEKCSREYFMCSNGYTYKSKCAAALYFDVELSVCDSWGNIFACSGQPKRTTTPRTTTVRDSFTTEKLPMECQGKPDGEYVDPLAKCSSTYYVCSNGIAYRQDCPHELFFEADLKVCADFLDVFDCAGKTRPPTTPRITTPHAVPKDVPIDCSNKKDGDYVDPHSECSQLYYSCSNHIGFERQCPFDLYFDITEEICDIHANVPACSGKPRPVTELTTSLEILTSPSPFDCSTKENRNYPAGDCEEYFWVCVGGHTSRQDCPRGLRFDDELNMCNFGEFMPKCGGVREESTTASEVITEAPHNYPVDCSKLPDGNVADPLSGCSGLFYMCANGVTYEQKCQAGLRYHVEKDECGHISEIPACGGQILNDPIPPKKYPYHPKYDYPTTQADVPDTTTRRPYHAPY